MAHIGNAPASFFTAVSSDVFSANGTATEFTLSRQISNLADIEVIVNNIQQNPFSDAYTVSNTTLTFSEAPSSGSNNIVVTYRQATIGSTIPTPNTVGNNALQSNLSLTGTTTTQHLVPSANITYDIGTSTMRYRDLYLSGNTINLGEVVLTTNGTAFSVANSTGGVFPSTLGNTNVTGTLQTTDTITVGNSTVNTLIHTTGITANGAGIHGINASSIATGTLDTARLPATANISTAINVGANVNLTTSTISIGNSTVNSVINSSSITTVSNTVTFGSSVYMFSNGNIGLRTSNTVNRQLVISRASEAQNEQLEFRVEGGITTGNYSGIVWTQSNNGATPLGSVRLNYNSNGQPDMAFNLRNDSNVLFLRQGGYVGINNAAPISPFHVTGINMGTGTSNNSFVGTFDSGSSQSAGIKVRYNANNSTAAIFVSGSGGAGIQTSHSNFTLSTYSNNNINSTDGSVVYFNNIGIAREPYVRYTTGSSAGQYSTNWGYATAEKMIGQDGNGLVSVVRNNFATGGSGATFDVCELTVNNGWNGGWFIVELFCYGYYITSAYRKWYIGGGYAASATELTGDTFGGATGFATVAITRTGSFANGTRSTSSGTVDQSYFRYLVQVSHGAYVNSYVKLTFMASQSIQAEDTTSAGQLKLI